MKKKLWSLLLVLVLMSNMSVSATITTVDGKTRTVVEKLVNGTTSSSGITLNVAADAPAAYVFAHTEGGIKYTYSVLDKDDNGNYLIYANDRYGQVTLNTTPPSNLFDPNPAGTNPDYANDANIGEWLNNDFLNGTSNTGTISNAGGEKTAYTVFDPSAKTYLVEKDWRIEGNNQENETSHCTAASKTDYTVTCKMSLLSYTDYLNYADKIGYMSIQYKNYQWSSDGSKSSWNAVKSLLRSPNTNSAIHAATIIENSGDTWTTNANVTKTNNYLGEYEEMFFRPLFWVSRDYFLNVKAENIGEEVKNILSSDYTYDELLGVYTEDELGDIFAVYDETLTLASVEITGDAYEYETVSAGYTAGGDYDAEKTVVKWYILDSADDAVATAAAEGEEYTIPPGSVGKYLKMSVQLKGDRGRYGDEVFSEAVAIQAARPLEIDVTGITVSGTPRPGYTMKLEDYAIHGEHNPDATVIKWVVSDTPTGDYRTVAEDVEEYKLRESDSGSYLRVSIRPVGYKGVADEAFSEAVQIAQPLTKYPSSLTNGTDINVSLLDNADYSFYENGSIYTIMEEEEDGVYVLSDSHLRRKYNGNGTGEFPPDNWQDPTDYRYISYYLNNEYLEGESGVSGKISGKAINEHIVDFLVEREYLTEGSGAGGQSGEDFVVKAKVMLPALWEYIEYSDRIGVRNTDNADVAETNSSMWFTRSPSTNSTHLRYVRVYAGNFNHGSVLNFTWENAYFRPVMSIGYDFFKTYKLDLENTGSEVFKMLTRRFSKDELAGLYTEAELAQIGFTAATANINSVSLTGYAASGSTVTMEFDDTKDVGVNYGYSWYVGNDTDGFARIAGAASESVRVLSKYVGQKLKAVLTVYDSATGQKLKECNALSDTVVAAKDFSISLTGAADTAAGKTASLDIVNNTGAESEKYMILAAFDENNVMLDVSLKKVKLSSGLNPTEISLDCAGAYVYRVMVWDSELSANIIFGAKIK